MTRDRADDYDTKKRLILRRAASLFASKGYEITTMMDVAKSCKASKSHLYHYFPAKEDLLFAIVHEHTAMLSEELTRINDLPETAERRFEMFVEAFVRIAADYRDEQLVLSSNIQFLPNARLKKIREMESDLVGLLTGLLKLINPKLMARTEVQGPFALLLFGMIIWTFTWYRRTGLIKPQELAGYISNLYLNGFKNQ